MIPTQPQWAAANRQRSHLIFCCGCRCFEQNRVGVEGVATPSSSSPFSNAGLRRGRNGVKNCRDFPLLIIGRCRIVPSSQRQCRRFIAGSSHFADADGSSCAGAANCRRWAIRYATKRTSIWCFRDENAAFCRGSAPLATSARGPAEVTHFIFIRPVVATFVIAG